MTKKSFSIGNKLGSALTETMTTSNEFKGKLRLEAIRISKVVLDSDNPRQLAITKEDVKNGVKKNDPEYEVKIKELENLNSLSNSIKKDGLLNAIVVYEDKGIFKLLAGERRTLAHILVGKERIPARILETKPSETQFAIMQWNENIERKDLTLWEKLLNLKKIFRTKQPNQKEVEETLGCGKTMAYNYSVLLKPMNKRLKESLKSGVVNSINKFMSLRKLDENEIDELLYNKPIEEATEKSIAKKAKNKTKRSTRGAKVKTISLGETKNVLVARTIYNALMKSQHMKKVADLMPEEPDWKNNKSINSCFEEIIFLLNEAVKG